MSKFSEEINEIVSAIFQRCAHFNVASIDPEYAVLSFNDLCTALGVCPCCSTQAGTLHDMLHTVLIRTAGGTDTMVFVVSVQAAYFLMLKIDTPIAKKIQELVNRATEEDSSDDDDLARQLSGL